MHWLINLLLGSGLEPRAATGVLLLGDLLALATVPSVLLHRRGRPRGALSWLLTVFALPLVGVAAWWLLGRTHLRRRLRRRRASCMAVCDCAAQPPDEEALKDFDRIIPARGAGRRAEGAPFPPTCGNAVGLRVDGPSAFGAMFEAVRAAERQVHAMFYIWRADETGRALGELLIEKARAGLEVRVVVDALGGRGFRRLGRQLTEAGGHVAHFLPPRFLPWAPTFNFRNHRKLLIVDEQAAFIGGMNVADEYARDWHDLAVRLEGPGVAQLQHVFLEDWHTATGETLTGTGCSCSRTGGAAGDAACAVVASGPDERGSWIQDALFGAITSARERVWLITPYFIPSDPIVAALRAAAQRDVDVCLLLPLRCDHWLVGLAARAYYDELLAAGVRIVEYDRTVLHAKALVIDRKITLIGSANTDVRSFRLNFELGCLFASPELNAALAAVFEADCRASRPHGPSPAGPRRGAGAVLESLAHLLSPLM